LVTALAWSWLGGAAPATAQGVDSKALLVDPGALAAWIAAHHPEVMAAQAGVRSAEAERRASRVLQNPSLQLNVAGLTAGKVRAPASDYGDPINFGVGLQQTFEIGKRGPRGAAADLRAEGARQNKKDVLAQQVAYAREALGRVVYLHARQAILEERVAAARQVVELEGVRLQHGDISGTDHDRLRLEQASIERDAADNRASLAVALADCAIAVAAPCDVAGASMADVDAAAGLPETLPGGAGDPSKQPSVRALELEHDASLEDAALYSHRAIPDPTVGLAYTRDFYTASGAQPHTLGVAVSIPLPFFDDGSAQADSSRALAMQAHDEAVARAAQLRSDVSGLGTRKAALEHKLGLLGTDLLPLSTSVLSSAEQAFHSGQLSLTDFLLVRRQHSALVLDQIDTRYELFGVRNALRRALGLDAQEPN
jgi:cobalt-zinc-cadmium efflux system outer membrane protein